MRSSRRPPTDIGTLLESQGIVGTFFEARQYVDLDGDGTLDIIIAGAAGEEPAVAEPYDGVVAILAEEGIGAEVAGDPIIAAACEDDIVAGRSLQYVAERRARDVFEVADGIEPDMIVDAIEIHGKPTIEGDIDPAGYGTTVVSDAIKAVAAVQDVVALIAALLTTGIFVSAAAAIAFTDESCANDSTSCGRAGATGPAVMRAHPARAIESFHRTFPPAAAPVKREPPEDAKEWEGKPDKEKEFSSKPGQGD